MEGVKFVDTTWWKLAKDKHYREEYALAMLKRMIPYQARAMRKKRGWKQAQLAEASNITQGVISRAEDPNYGNLTLNTIGRMASGFDVAVIIRFVPFSHLLKFSRSLSEKEFAEMPSFAFDSEPIEQPVAEAIPELPPKKPARGQEESREDLEEKISPVALVAVGDGTLSFSRGKQSRQWPRQAMFAAASGGKNEIVSGSAS